MIDALMYFLESVVLAMFIVSIVIAVFSFRCKYCGGTLTFGWDDRIMKCTKCHRDQ